MNIAFASSPVQSYLRAQYAFQDACAFFMEGWIEEFRAKHLDNLPSFFESSLEFSYETGTVFSF